MNLRRTFLMAGLAGGGLVAGFGLKTVLADGIPDTNPLYYSGTLTENGVPASGIKDITVNLWSAQTGGTMLCQTLATGQKMASITNGRFRIPLDQTCKTAINQNNNPWVEIVDGATPLGRSKIGAVPFAVEAEHATTATHASSADTSTNAIHATSADTATTATHAGSADTATNAGHATSAATADFASLAGAVTATAGSTLLGGSPPAGTKFIWQGGTFVGTSDSNGHLNFSFPTAFPNGLVTVVITNSFAQSGNDVAGILDNENLGGFTVGMTGNQLIRINWIALGW